MNKIDRIYNLLKHSKSFFVANIEGDKPNVRPFNAVVKSDGKIYLYTNRRTSAYRQLSANPHLSICALANEDRWLKLTASAVFDGSISAKTALLEANPALKKMYSVDDKILEVFYLEKITAKIHSNYTSPEIICKEEN